MSRRNGTDGSLLSSLPWSLFALAAAAATHLPYLPIWVTVALVGCGAARLVIERRRWRLPGPIPRMLLAVLCFLAVLGSYQTISGVGPGAALLTMMAALKLLETRRRRDQYVLLFIAIFLILTSLLREQYVWSLPYMLVAMLVTLTAWLQMSAVGNRPARYAMLSSLRMLGYAAPLMIVMWVFFPRIATPFWAVPIDTSSGTTGVSNEMSPGDISSLSASDAVAFRVEFESTPPPPKDRYWRGLVLTRFNGRTWTAFDPVFGRRDSYPIEYLDDPVRYRITLEPTRQQWVFALDLPADWNLSNTFMGPQQQLARVHPIDQLVAYDVTSYTNYRLAPEKTRGLSDWYTDHPRDSNPRTLQLARDLRARVSSDADYAAAVLTMFAEQEFYYTLDPPRLGANSVDQFLFNTREGFCEHYASAFGLLMRAAGIPARVVVGYQGGSINPMNGQLTVRQSDAHAWNEIWLADRGWVRMDPTSAVAPDRIDMGMAAARFDAVGIGWGLTAPSQLMFRMELAWDMITAKWNQWVVAYGPDQQQSFMEWLGMDNPTLRKMLFTLIMLVATLLVGITALLAWRFRPPTSDPAARLFARFQSRARVPAELGEPPLAYGARLVSMYPEHREQVDAVIRSYLEVRYGPAAPTDLSALQSLISAFRAPKAA